VNPIPVNMGNCQMLLSLHVKIHELQTNRSVARKFDFVNKIIILQTLWQIIRVSRYRHDIYKAALSIVWAKITVLKLSYWIFNGNKHNFFILTKEVSYKNRFLKFGIHKNIVFLCIIYCVTNAVAVMYSRNILMAEKRTVCFQSKKVKICRF